MALPPYTFVGCHPSNYTPLGSRRIDGIIDHSIVGSIQSATNRFLQPNSQRASAGAGIGLDGKISMWVEPWDIAHHSGDWPTNVTTFGIEHEDDGDPYDPERTPELYLASAALHVALAAEEGFELAAGITVRGHRDIVATACPAGLDLLRILTLAEGGAVDFVPMAEFRAYQENVRLTIEAMKKVYDPLVDHKHLSGPPQLRAAVLARRRAAMRDLSRRLAALRPPEPRRKPAAARKRAKPTAAQLREARRGHGPGRPL